jgi:hypothetical protein
VLPKKSNTLLREGERGAAFHNLMRWRRRTLLKVSEKSTSVENWLQGSTAFSAGLPLLPSNLLVAIGFPIPDQFGMTIAATVNESAKRHRERDESEAEHNDLEEEIFRQ